jgi:hypothetical protein
MARPHAPQTDARSSSTPGTLAPLNANAAGIDVGSASHFVAVPADRDAEPVREFGAFPADLQRLAEWLRACGIETVALESTGVYWIPLFRVLEERGFEVKLVDAHHLSRVPGRKTDVLDCQWLQQLHRFGLLNGAFRPDDQICVLRSYMRQRAMLVTYAGQHVQHLHKALVQMNLQLGLVLEDITGATGLRILRAILDGERDGHRLAALRHGKCKHSAATIAKALEGDWREEHLLALAQALELIEAYRAKIADCDTRIQAHLQTFDDRSDGQASPQGPPPRADRHDRSFDATAELFRLTGVDLTAITGFPGAHRPEDRQRDRCGHEQVADGQTLRLMAGARAEQPREWRHGAAAAHHTQRQPGCNSPAGGGPVVASLAECVGGVSAAEGRTPGPAQGDHRHGL